MSEADPRPASRTPATATMTLAGTALVPDVTGALYVACADTLIVADLHFEKGSAYAVRGLPLPPYDTRTTLKALEQACRRHKPHRVVALGDSFHDCQGSARLAAGDRERIRALTSAHSWIWVTGNHDPEPPQALGGTSAEVVELGSLVLRHEPTPGAAEGEIAGHLHPAAAVVMRGRRLRRRCFAGDGTRLVMPAFGALTGGLCVKSNAFAGLFDASRLEAWLIGRDRVYAVAGRKLRPA